MHFRSSPRLTLQGARTCTADVLQSTFMMLPHEASLSVAAFLLYVHDATVSIGAISNAANMDAFP